MKKILSNNHGYSIFIVLLTIVVFTILALSFTVQSANSKRQNEIVEDNYQSIALAEMGSQFYMTAIKNEFDEMKQIAKDTQEAYLSRYEPEDITELVIQEARQEGIKAAYNYLNNRLVADSDIGLPRTKSVNNVSPSPLFLIENVALSPLVNNQSTITFDSIGMENGSMEGNNSTIEGKLEIDLSQMNVTQPKKEDYIQTYANLISDPDPNNQFPTCSPEDILKDNQNNHNYESSSIRCNSDKTIAKVSGNFSYKKLQDNISTLYVTGDLTDANGNDSYSNLKIHVAQNAIMGNLNNSFNVIIEVMGDLTIPKNLNNAENVTICVHGKLTFTGNSNNTSNITIFEKSRDSSAFKSGGACVGDNPGESKNPHWQWDIPMINKEEYNYS